MGDWLFGSLVRITCGLVVLLIFTAINGEPLSFIAVMAGVVACIIMDTVNDFLPGKYKRLKYDK
jgi:hypothetical protein